MNLKVPWVSLCLVTWALYRKNDNCQCANLIHCLVQSFPIESFIKYVRESLPQEVSKLCMCKDIYIYSHFFSFYRTFFFFFLYILFYQLPLFLQKKKKIKRVDFYNNKDEEQRSQLWIVLNFKLTLNSINSCKVSLDRTIPLKN